MNAVRRLQVAMNKIDKNSLYYQTLYLPPPPLQRGCSRCVRQTAMAPILHSQLLSQTLIKKEK